MEFLITYGWAILVIISVLSALVYLGFIQPKDSMVDVKISDCVTLSGYYPNITCKDLNISDGCQDYVEIIDNSTLARVLTTRCAR